MNKKILLSLISSAAMLTLVVGATYAFFSDNSTSNNNTFASGSLNLQLDDSDETTPAESVTGSITATDFAPGQSVSGFISLHNPGSLPIAEVEMTIDTTETLDGGVASDMREVLALTVLEDDLTPDANCSGGTNITSAIDTQVGDGVGSLLISEFDNLGVDIYDAISGIGVGNTRNVCFTVTFQSTAGNEYQGDALSSTITFTGNQDASQ